MDFSDIVAITGMPGLYVSVAKRQDGMIVSALGDDKSKFVSARIHMFTPLENITVYTNEDSVTLREVFRDMKTVHTDIDQPEPNSANDVLKDYFVKVLPDYDKDKVYVSDIKKMIKWYKAIDEQNLLTDELLADSVENQDEEVFAEEKPVVEDSSEETPEPETKTEANEN